MFFNLHCKKGITNLKYFQLIKSFKKNNINFVALDIKKSYLNKD